MTQTKTFKYSIVELILINGKGCLAVASAACPDNAIKATGLTLSQRDAQADFDALQSDHDVAQYFDD